MPAAAFLAQWAIRSAENTVLEPCCGEGVFLRAARRRTAQIGEDLRGGNVTAVELDGQARIRASAEVPRARLIHEDFFDLSPARIGTFDAVIGNPPFVRYHLFTGDARQRALWLARTLGVQLSGLTSSWVPFLLHASRFLKLGGRMAVVVPYELTYAIYARPFIEYVASRFASVTLLIFGEPLFPELNEKAALLLCDGFGGRTPAIDVVHLPSLAHMPEQAMPTGCPILAKDLVTGAFRVRLLEVSQSVRRLYSTLGEHAKVVRLGDNATLTIGYVTGDNAFFHMNRERALSHGLPLDALRIAVRKGSDLNTVGLGLTEVDASRLVAAGENLLFYPEQQTRHPAVTAYIQSGESTGRGANNFKARARRTWWRVPGVSAPDMFLTVFGHSGPRLVANDAGVVATNSVLVLRLREGAPGAHALAAAARTTLAALSAEIEGHHLGGGALKFEPCEARRWMLPARVALDPSSLVEIDRALREGNLDRANDLADRSFLMKGLGLTHVEVLALREAVQVLREGRTKRRQCT